MKKLSETYKELGIAFTFPIEIKDSNGNETYYENSNGVWWKNEYDDNGKRTYHENSDGFWSKHEYDAKGNETYYGNSNGFWWKREYDDNGNRTYYENSDGFWSKREYDDNGKLAYHENSDGFWSKREYDVNGNQTYCEHSDGSKRGTPRSQSHDVSVNVPENSGEITIKMPDPTEVIIKAELDDKAFAVGDFIQQLGEVQEQKFEALWKECKEKEWIKGMEEATARDWLFDYVFNGWEKKDTLGFQETFSEYVEVDHDEEVYETVVVKSRYGDERKFTIIEDDRIEYSFKDVDHVGCSRDDDGSLHSVDPSGGPYISIGTMLGNVNKELEGLTVTKIKHITEGLYHLTVK